MSIARSGPGCGGTNPCRIDRPARAGMPTFIRDRSSLRATRMTTGTSRTTPTSKNSGIPRMKAISAIIQGSRRGLTPPINRSTIVSDPPESWSNLPIIAPSAMSRPTDPVVLPRPLVKLVTMSAGCTPATPPMTAAPMIRARKGWNLAQLMSSTTAAIPANAASSNWVLPASVSLGGASAKGRATDQALVKVAVRLMRGDLPRYRLGRRGRARSCSARGPGVGCPRRTRRCCRARAPWP